MKKKRIRVRDDREPAFHFTRIEILVSDRVLERSYIREIRTWCKEAFGPALSEENRMSNIQWYIRKTTRHRDIRSLSNYGVKLTYMIPEAVIRIYFRHPEHASLFALKWS